MRWVIEFRYSNGPWEPTGFGEFEDEDRARRIVADLSVSPNVSPLLRYRLKEMST